MNFIDFVEKIKQKVESGKTRRETYSYLSFDDEKNIAVQGLDDIITPPSFKDVKLNILGSFGGPYYLSISAQTSSMNIAEIDSMVRLLLMDLQSMSTFPANAIRFHSQFSWDAEQFKQEKTLATIVAQNVDLKLFTKIMDPTPRLPHAHYYDLHNINVTSYDEGISLSVYGNYTHYFRDLAESLQPDWALLKISAHDRQRIERNKTTLGKKLTALMEKAASTDMPRILAYQHQTAQLIAHVFNRETGINIAPENCGTTLVIPYQWVNAYEDCLHLPLLNPGKNQETKVERVVRTYHPLRQRLATLKTLLEVIERAELDVLYDHPLITTATAKEYIEQELLAITQAYSSEERGKKGNADIMLKRMMCEYYGDPVGSMTSGSDEFCNSNPPDRFFGYLQSKGYTEVPKNAWTYSVDEFRDQLLHDFQELLHHDSGKSVESYRKYFTNQRPLLTINASVSADASNILKIIPPARGFSTWLSLDANPQSSQKCDGLGLYRMPDEEYMRFHINVPLDSGQQLLVFQTHVCEKLGFDFR